MIEDVEEYITNKTGYHPGNNITHQSNLVSELKKQIKVLKKQIATKEEQLDAYKRNPKVLKIQELQMELQTYSDQAIRLDELTQETIRESQQHNEQMLENKQDSYIQLDLIQNLQSDNAKIHASLKELDEKNLQLSIIKDQEEKECKKLADELEYLQQTLTGNEDEIVELKNEIEQIVAQNQELQEKAAKFPNEKAQTDEQLYNSDAKIKKLIEEKNIIIEQQDKQIKELQNKLNEKNQVEEKEIAKLDSELTSLQDNFADLEARYNVLQDEYNSAQLKRLQTPGKLQENSIVTINNDKLNQLNKKFKKVQKVKLLDIKQYGMEINLRLKLKRITIEEVQDMLLESMNRIGAKKGYISIEEMQQILQEEPFLVDYQFNLKENFPIDPEKIISKSLQISRYLIEDNDEELLELDLERTEKNIRVISVLKKLISNYSTLTEEEDILLMKDVSTIITKYKGNLIPSLDYVQNKDPSIYMSMDKIWQAFNFLDIGFTQKQFDYLILKMFKDTNTLEKLEFMSMFQIFNEENAIYQYNAYESKKAKVLEQINQQKVKQQQKEQIQPQKEYKELFEKEFGDQANKLQKK